MVVLAIFLIVGTLVIVVLCRMAAEVIRDLNKWERRSSDNKFQKRTKR